MRRSTVLRDRGDQRIAHVTNMELFFDLVYVFAITQLSEHLYDDRTVRGGLQTTVLFLAVWWAWNYTAWATNWIDPDRTPVVVLLAVLMAISLVMSAAIPDAFGAGHHDRAEPFALAYVALQLVRSAFMVWAFGFKQTMGRNYAQLLAWSAIAGVAWIAGGFVHDPDLRLAVWAGAIVLDLGAPLHGFRLPGVAGTPIGDWTLAGGHLAERCQLVLMVAFGESVLRVGETLAHAHGAPGVDAAFLLGFVLTVALWSIYFLRHAEHGADAIASSPDQAARIGRSAYAYAHAIMVGGVIVLAVAIRLAISEPTTPATASFAIITLGGPALYLAGVALYKHSLARGRAKPPLVGIVALAALGIPAAFADRLDVLIVATVVAAVLALLAARDDEPEPGEAAEA